MMMYDIISSVSNLKGNIKILFYVTEVAHFWDAMKPLFYKYLEVGANCTVVFPVAERIIEVGRGKRNRDRMDSIIAEIERGGGKWFYLNDWNRNFDQYDICFIPSDYIQVDFQLRKCCRYIVAVQITPIYTHVYVGHSTVEQLFGEENCKIIDYYIVSQFIADWINNKIEFPQGKLLKFGYPRLDDLYKALRSCENITAKLNKKKKVFMVVGSKDYPYWLESVSNEAVFIYRPHPFTIEQEEADGTLERLRCLGNVIIDNSETYYNAFKISDALISPILCSLATNYLLTDKPVLLLDDVKFETKRMQHVEDYYEEAWYKASYIAKTENDIGEFIKMVEAEEDWLISEHSPYREYMQQHFDGKVCERIIDFFDKCIAENK